MCIFAASKPKNSDMETPTKKTWQYLIADIAEDIEHAEWEVRDAHKKAEQRIEDTKDAIDWNWEWYSRDGTPIAVHWDDATDEDEAMLDYAAKVNHTWPGVSSKISRARQLLQEAYEELNQLYNDGKEE